MSEERAHRCPDCDCQVGSETRPCSTAQALLAALVWDSEAWSGLGGVAEGVGGWPGTNVSFGCMKRGGRASITQQITGQR